MVIDHTNCGTQHISSSDMVNAILARKIFQEIINACRYFEVDFNTCGCAASILWRSPSGSRWRC